MRMEKRTAKRTAKKTEKEENNTQRAGENQSSALKIYIAVNKEKPIEKLKRIKTEYNRYGG